MTVQSVAPLRRPLTFNLPHSLTFLFFFLCLVTFASPIAAQPPSILRLAFTRRSRPPSGWTRYNASALTISPTPPKWLRLPASRAAPPFRFALLARSFTYTMQAPPGRYVARFGARCHKRRALLASQGCPQGCGPTYFVDAAVESSADGVLTLELGKLAGFWPPAIANIELFRAADAPSPFHCPGSDPISPSPSSSPSISTSPSPSASSSSSNAPQSSSSSLPGAPVLRVVFSRAATPPQGWTIFTRANLSVLPNPIRFFRYNSAPHSLRFVLVASSFAYTATLPAPGQYVARVGSYAPPSCSARRAIRLSANNADTPLANPEAMCGCDTPVFHDVVFDADDATLTLRTQKEPGYWAPTIGSLEVYKIEDAPPAFACPRSTPASSVPASVSALPSPTASPSVSVLASASASLSAAPSLSPSSSTATLPSSVPGAPVLRVVFSRATAPPSGWSLYSNNNLSVIPNNPLKFLRYNSAPESLRFLLVATSFTYTTALPVAGRYVARVGSFAPQSCRSRRALRLSANDEDAPLAAPEAVCGCGIPSFHDVTFDADDATLTLRMQKEAGYWAPTIGSLEVYKVEDAPPPFTCTGSTVDATASPSASVSAPIDASPDTSSSVSVSASPTLSASASASLPAGVTPSQSASASASTSVFMPPLPSTSENAGTMLTSSPIPSASPGLKAKDVNINIAMGSTNEARYLPPGSEQVSAGAPVKIRSTLGLPPDSFFSALLFDNLTMTFSLPPGTYNVILGFAELSESHCAAGARVFDVLLNGARRFASVDVFSAAGCRTSHALKALRETIPIIDARPFTLSVQGVAGQATLSHVRIRGSQDQCVPVAGAASGNDGGTAHLAHAVPGSYPPSGEDAYVDADGDGLEMVTLDGSGSHTHASYGSRHGRITAYEWRLQDTGEVISTAIKFSRNFSLGSTAVVLSVIDDGCSRHEAGTTITVTGRMQRGAYCYYYAGMTNMPLGGTLMDEDIRPAFAAPAQRLDFEPDSWPRIPFRSAGFVARCVFFMDMPMSTQTEMSAAAAGAARLYKGSELVLDTATSTSVTTSTVAGLQQYELLYQYDGSVDPSLTLRVNGSVPALSYDQTTVLPVLSAISPQSGRVVGGAKRTLTGYGMYGRITVMFGDAGNVTAQKSDATPQQAYVLPPAASHEGSVSVRVMSPAGVMSNAVNYTFGSTCDPIKFNKKYLTMPSGREPDLGLPTSTAMLSDGSLLIGTRQGAVHRIRYGVDDLVIKHWCQSKPLTDSRFVDKKGDLSTRSILGLVVDPRDPASVYASVSTMYWQKQEKVELSNTRAWANGVIVRFVNGEGNECLSYADTVVRNLPVGNGDHAVNEIAFDQNGDLLIAVGGFTNAGLPKLNLGNVWETYLSGAVLLARIASEPAFNGTIEYSTPDNLRTAVPLSDHVQLYATGLRNLFSLFVARSGRVYGVDMGPNCPFGNASSTCSQYDEAAAAKRPYDSKEGYTSYSILGDPGECRYGDTRKDKLLQIRPGAWYGHPNLQRAALRPESAGECAYIDPNTDRTGLPARARPPPNYARKVAFTLTPMTGLREYGAAHFCGHLRNNLVGSRYKGRGTFRFALDESAPQTTLNLKVRISQRGALRLEENVMGDLLFPRYTMDTNVTDGRRVPILRPVYTRQAQATAVNALPYRHGRQGGTPMMVGGYGFKQAASISVMVGSAQCVVSSVTDAAVTCTVPPASFPGERADVTIDVDGVENVLQGAVLYMNV